MKAGVLVCHKEPNVIKSYEQDKSKFTSGKNDIYQTFREFQSTDASNTGFELKLFKKNGKMSEDVKRRLYMHSTPEVPPRAECLLSKFGSLFQDTPEKQSFKSFNSRWCKIIK